MFSNLIESGSHAADLKRKGRFFVGTVAFYSLLTFATGVGSIYAYNARLDEPNDEYEILSLMRFPPSETRTEPQRREESHPAANNHTQQFATRPELSYQTPYHGDNIAKPTTREAPTNVPVVIAPFTSDPVTPGGSYVPGLNNGSGIETGPAVRGDDVETTPPPQPRVAPTPAPTPKPERQTLALPSTIISSKVISKPAPPYPVIARQGHIQGPVAVQIVVDEQGRVISAKATSGNPLLMNAAVQAAYQARFTPTILGGQPVKVTGSITYNFVLN